MFTAAQKQHEWLRKFVGTWEMQSEAIMGPDQPPCISTGTETVRMLGDLWAVFESTMAFPGDASAGAMQAMMVLGFDPNKNKYVGSWIGSPMAHQFMYEGVLKESFNDQGHSMSVLALDTTGPSFSDPTKMARYQDVIELHGDDKRLLWSQTQGDDGQWMRFMTATYTRMHGR